jgi:glycosyltransferase involved in cell wall biosynthesis
LPYGIALQYIIYQQCCTFRHSAGTTAATFGFSLFIDIKEMESNSANKFFDTLASGIPPLINYGGWQKNILEEHNSGLVINRNAKLAAHQIINLLDDSDRYTEMSINAHNLALSHFDRDKLASKLETILIDSAS